MERPPADPAKLLSSWGEWESGETPPGRVVSNLKTGGLRDVLEHVSLDGEGVDDGVRPGDALGAWMEWETGATPPAPVMTRLHEAGVRTLLEEMVAAADAGVGEG